MEIFLAVFIALVCIILIIIVRVLDYKIEKLGILINNLNNWAYHQGRLTRQIVYKLEAVYDTHNSKESVR